ncbi:DNA polymerase/3'-5' exonuclease PolX [Pedobacter cryophilus]|uniref:DNA polymerase/3'-5' exonuclease PolX n=1 Tax=Pedobacter cryophilus TaxID=2571271 RepID=A0A4U1BYJ9_9SPHI|nr:DNA polymerase/3'-5' exonuclease PolX [Pedobacter cryophilus]TKB95270.1 DNA polymerase/3'-5' exonuclease PolX [Pedobacter cryophilus]
MENKEISRALKLLSQLMELHQENSFKIKSITNASFKVDKLPFKLKDKTKEELEKIDGIGKSIASKITELLQTNTIQDIEDLISNTPAGVVEMLSIKGLGPKKIEVIWNFLGIENLGELYYACNENRLIEAKGFGLKTQEEIKKAIEFKMANAGRFLYAKIEKLAESYLQEFTQTLQKIDPDLKIVLTGAFRRKCEIIEELEYLFISDDASILSKNLFETEQFQIIYQDETHLHLKDLNGINIKLWSATSAEAGLKLFETTGCATHVEKVKAYLKPNQIFTSEGEIYAAAKMDFIAPELREDGNEIEKALKYEIKELIKFEDLKGTLHNHSTWSDGVHKIEEMAIYCRDTLALSYLGMCDHSKTAVYANGLSIERVLQQQEEIDYLNKKLAPFKIFKGIESDILGDGSLDYPDEILKKFDFVVASVHSNLKMDEEKATQRLIRAIENPYTTILGHPTGRLLLSRSGYPLDFKKIIDACAANHVVIEINANPLRLDLDWRWHQYALEQGVLLSINPDAHRNEGFLDMQYGINVARKGGLYPQKCLNSFSLPQINTFFEERKSTIKI